MPTSFTGGSLSFKGDKKKKKKKTIKKKLVTTKHELLRTPPGEDEHSSPVVHDNNNNDYDNDMTHAEQKAMKRKRERERIEHEQLAMKSHRERIEEFNDKLSQLTEHNDIPRVCVCVYVNSWWFFWSGVKFLVFLSFLSFLYLTLGFLFFFFLQLQNTLFWYRSALLEMVNFLLGKQKKKTNQMEKHTHTHTQKENFLLCSVWKQPQMGCTEKQKYKIYKCLNIK